MKKLFLSVLPLMLLFLISCKKNSGAKSNEEKLMSGSWKIQAASANGSDVMPLVPSCVKDNKVSFQTGGIGFLSEETDICNPSNETNFLWSLINNDTQLSMSANIIPGGTGAFTIVTLSESSLVLSQESSLIPSPTPVTVVISLVH
ncbi:MAG: hypothetical protein GC171_08645 [Terrimonas sp.]|nr:hypothetical protein [Terrimonas sp.]